MNARKIWLCLSVCLITATAFGEDAITPFAKTWLGFDLKSCPLGKLAQTNGEFGETGLRIPAPMSDTTMDEATWYTNLVSAQYTKNFPNRVLIYGFRDGRLAAVRISISAFANQDGKSADQATFEARKQELIRIQDELRKAKAGADPSGYRVQYTANCSPDPKDIGYAAFQITLAEKIH